MAERVPIVSRRNPQTVLQRDQIEASRRRHEELVPIHFMYTSNVPRELARACLIGVQQAVNESGQERDIKVFRPTETWGNGSYRNIDWYVHEVLRTQGAGWTRDMRYGIQMVADRVFRLFYHEPFQVRNPHWEVLIVNRDLRTSDAENNFVFGLTDTLIPASIQSIRRIITDVADPELQKQLLRRLLRHEVGHMFGLPSRDERTIQLLGKHCTNPCSMRQGLSLPEWVMQSREEKRLGVHYCGDCKVDFRRVKQRFSHR